LWTRFHLPNAGLHCCVPNPVTLQAVMRFLAIFLNIVNACGMGWLCVTDVVCLYVQINFNLFVVEMVLED
jgi:hypothetical protein